MSTSKKILILCDAFGPPAWVPRVTSLARELRTLGWDVQVMSEIMPGFTYETKDFPLELMRHYSTNKIRYAFQWLADKLWQAKEKAFTRFVEKHTKVQEYDAILCSSFNLFPLLTAATLAKKHQKPLFVDLRDIAEQADARAYFQHKMPTWLSKWYIRRNIRLRNKVLQQATAVTTVSPWHVEQLKRYNPNTYLIYNGYDAQVFQPKDVVSKQFTIAYTGKLYDFQLSGLKLFAEALTGLPLMDLRLLFHIGEEWHDVVREYFAGLPVDIQGYVPREEVLDVLHEASILLVLTDKTAEAGPHGMMTTKFYEALGVEKPVLCVRSDEDCLAAAIEETNAGIAAKSIEETTAFILDKYEEWKQNGFTHQPVRNKFLFTRQEQAKQFAELLRLGQKTKDKGQRTKDEGRRIIEARLISVIIPIYNAGKYLETCLHSLRLQTYSNLQVIMIDDGSTDHSAHIAQRFVDIDERFMLIRQANAGQSAARNRGLEKATGAFVSFVDADDLLDVDYYDLLVHNIGTNDVLQTGYTLIDEQGEQLDIHYPNSFYQYTTPWSRFFRRDWLCEHNLRFEEGQIYEDVLFSIDVWLANPTHSFYPYSGYQYRINPTSTTAKKHDTKNLFSLIAQRQKKAKGWHKLLILHTRIRLWLHFLLGRK